MNYHWSKAAAQLIENRPSLWEYRLFSQCLIESVERNLSASCKVPSTSKLSEPEYTLIVASMKDGEHFITRILDEVKYFIERLEFAINISSSDATSCFGPPGQPGDPRSIAELANRLTLNIQACRKNLTEIQCFKVVAEKSSLQCVCNLFLRSLQSYVRKECDGIERFVRNIGPRLLEELESGNLNINFSYKFSTCRAAIEPLVSRLESEFRPKSRIQVKTPILNTIKKASIHVTFVDTETTGLSEHDEPISIGAVKYEVNPETGILCRVIDTYYELRDTAVSVGDQALQIHGISNDQLRGKRWDMDRVKSILGADLIVAHNAEFDMRMLSKLMMIDASLWACSMNDLNDIWGRRSWISLDNLVDRFGLERPIPHNALSDAQTLAQVVAQRLPTSLVAKTVLWELCRRHFGFEPINIENNDFIVWGHYTPEGTLLFVWTARLGEPSGPEDNFFLSYYINKNLPGGCVVLPVKGDLSFDEALEVKSEFLKNDHATLLNRINNYRPLNQPGVEARQSFNVALNQGRSLEKVDADAAISHYMTAIRVALEGGDLQVDSGLIGQLQSEIDRSNNAIERLLLKPLDRISLLLCTKGAPDRALSVLEEVKSKYPAVVELTEALPIIKRINREIGKSVPLSR